MKCSRRDAGWTLMELIAVVVLLIVVAALLLPVFGRVSREAHGIKCAANLRQLASVHLSYTSDHNGAFVAYTDRHGAAGNGGSAYNSWPEAFVALGYLPGDGKVFVCPALPGAANTKLVKSANQEGLRYTYVHYGYNYQHVGGSLRYPEHGDEYTPAKLSQLNRPGRTLLLLDAYRRGDGATPDVGRYVVRDNRGGTDYFPHARHRSGLNVAFADGHVEYIRVAEVDNPWQELGQTTEEHSLWKRVH